jgi:hypothetical protein
MFCQKNNEDIAIKVSFDQKAEELHKQKQL